MIVMKFGGTSVAGKNEISRAVEIIASRLNKKPVVVVSAMSKVTDLLYKLAEAAASKQTDLCEELLNELRTRHIRTAEDLLEGKAGYLLPALSCVNEICDGLATTVGAVCALGELSDRSKASIVSNGELLSSSIIAHVMNAAGIRTEQVNARDMIITSGDVMNGEPDLASIQDRVPGIIEKAFEGNDAVISQGFISRSKDGVNTVLGRGGSDYSASLIGMAINAEAIEIWTDVDGVLTADPRVVEGALRLSRLSFEEAAEMAHFGAKVLHPQTIEPAVRKNIPICVLNSKNPECEGTLILNDEQIEDGVKSVSFKERILVINMFSTKMINTSGFLSKVFDVFKKNNISIDLISTTEANISVTCEESPNNIEKVIEELSEFASISIDRDKAQISVIGKNLVNLTGTVQKVFDPIEDTKVYMISQGSSYINLTMVVDRAELKAAVIKIHNSLFN